MTESYDLYANAIAKRIKGILKGEFIGYRNKHSLEAMDMFIKNSIDIYNERRPHFSSFTRLRDKCISKMHQQNEIKIKTYKNKYPSNHVITGI